MSLDTASGTINNYKVFNKNPISVNNVIAPGTYTFTVKVAVGSDFATKQFSIEVVPDSDKRPIIMFGNNMGTNINNPIRQGGGFNVACGWSPSGCYLYYTKSAGEYADPVCSVVGGRLPQGTSIVSLYQGCTLVGVP